MPDVFAILRWSLYLTLVAVSGCATLSTFTLPTLKEAVQQQDWQAMQTRFSMGTPVDERIDDQNTTALLRLAQNNRLDLVQDLLKLGANPYIQNQVGESALDYLPRTEPWVLALEDAGRSEWQKAVDAIQANETLRLARLMRSERFYRYTTNKRGDLLSHLAVRAACESCLATLAGADFDLVRVNPLTRQTPLMVAAQDAHLSLIQVLVQRNPTVNQKDRNGWTALHFACGSGRGENGEDKRRATLVRRLLNQGARTDLRTVERLTPLELAVARDYTEVVKVLLEHEAGAGKY